MVIEKKSFVLHKIDFGISCMLTIFACVAFKLRKVLLTIITSAGHSHRQLTNTLSNSHTRIHSMRVKRKSKQRKNNMLVIHEEDMDVKDTPMPKKRRVEVEEKRNETSKLKRKRKRIKNATIEFKCLATSASASA